MYVRITTLSHSLTLSSSLVTSSVSYCKPPETLLIQQFYVAYFAANSSISFNISAASVVSPVRLPRMTNRSLNLHPGTER